MGLCQCGCGKETRLERHRYIRGHALKGKTHSVETRDKLRHQRKGVKRTASALESINKAAKEHRIGFKPGYIPWNKGSGQVDSKPCDVCGEIIYGSPNALEGRRYCSYKCSRKGKGLFKEKSELTCIHCGKKFEIFAGNKQQMKRRFCSKSCSDLLPKSDDYRSKMSMATKGKIVSDETKLRQSKALKGKPKSDEAKHKMSLAAKRRFKDEEYLQRMAKLWGMKPNKSELFVLSVLNELYPDEWKYVGDFSLVINGRSPDFVNVNGKKLLVEFFGDYWHRGDDPEARKAIFREYGYETLVIWERELRDMEAVKNSICSFVSENCSSHHQDGQKFRRSRNVKM